ncbi:hypothetical protein M977_03786 [Buttiauxella gaviniae ATCC 51604]|uniref:Eaa protein n=1 Tax=Buttiauxella gaviniae ATCC 51604 TaxID=1354253 RepID=A0A1B7HQT2_9ENTR|nr:hypothetical protein [Buttiauxella gaviniae]OAT17998.1 hypothetical protein M977_03786 [Buttiauxella gaviniae ATCC 51604]
MTTNLMGLEQTLSDERLAKLAAEDDLYNYPPTQEELNGMARELLAYRKESSEPVADVVAWNKPGEERKCDIRWRRFDIAPGPLFTAPPLQLVPTGWKLVPVEPTENMVVEGFESEPDSFFSDSDEWAKYEAMSGCEQAAHKARLCWAAMIATSPSVTNEP